METNIRQNCLNGDDDLSSLRIPRRNRYFYGKLLDADHFDMETSYHNAKRWLLNRYVSGYGVVCGLSVKFSEDNEDAIVIEPGVAIDRHGREIIVPQRSEPIPIPPHLINPEKESDENVIHVLLCGHECPVEPEPVFVSGCHEPEPCEAGVILERYKVLFRKGCVEKSGGELRIPDVITGVKLEEISMDYDQLVRLVSEPCLPCPKDPCIPLAEIQFPVGEKCQDKDIDITVRPIVFTNDLLFQLLLSLIIEKPSYTPK